MRADKVGWIWRHLDVWESCGLLGARLAGRRCNCSVYRDAATAAIMMIF